MKINIIGSTAIIKVGVEFRNLIWSETYGEVYNILVSTASIDQLDFDFRECVWADPIPLLSVLLLSDKFIQSDFKVTLYLPKPSISTDQDNLLCFLSSEMFLTQFIDLGGNLKNENGDIKSLTIETYKTLGFGLFYADPTLITATLLNLNDRNKIDSWIEAQMQEVENRLRSKVRPWSIDSLLFRISMFLTEAIHNVYDHAYKGETRKPVALYARFRLGLANSSLTKYQKQTLNKKLGQEAIHSPRIPKGYLETKEGCIEFFIIDMGCGLSANLKKVIDLSRSEDLKYPFRAAFRAVFIDGVRGRKISVDRTRFGGLHFIGQLLSSSNNAQDYLVGFDQNTWVGNYFPLESIEESSLVIEANVPPPGLAWQVRFAWKFVSDDDSSRWNKWNKGAPKQNELNHPLLRVLSSKSKLSNGYFGRNNKKVHTTDLRFKFDFDHKSRLDSYLQSGASDNYCFYLPNSGDPKNTVLKKLESYSHDFSNSESRVLLIGEIALHEASVYIAALEGGRFQKFVKKFQKVILITTRLHVSILMKTKDSLAYDAQSTEMYLSLNETKSFAPDQNLIHYLSWLKYHDSVLFWSKVASNSGGKQLYINAKVEWPSTDKIFTLNGYLNFAQTLTEPFCKELFLRLLERTMALTDKTHLFQAEDLLTHNLVSEANQIFHNQDVNDKLDLVRNIFVGSVFVSGQTEKDFLNTVESTTSDVKVHYFNHSNVEGLNKANSINHFIFWPSEDLGWFAQLFKFDNTPYKRVGKSHVIAPHGWKYYPIPRYIEEGNKINSVYIRSPKQSYQDWQDRKIPQIITLGHFAYNNKHDLFHIDYRYVFSQSLHFGGNIALFILSEIVFCLGGSISDVTIENKVFRRKLVAALKTLKKNDPSEFGNTAVVLYPLHFNSSFIIDKIRSVLSPELKARIFSLIPVARDRNGSSFLISPLIFSPIKEAISEHKASKINDKTNLTIFDTTIVDGRTRKELKHLSFYLGADEVKTLSITERQRLPFTAPVRKKHKSYWRLDVPRLGTQHSCIFCKGIEFSDVLKEQITSSLALNRILQWQKAWKATNGYSKNSDHGIQSTQVALDKSHKKFSVSVDDLGVAQQIGGDTNKINITTSLGLVLYSLEIHSMTGRNDFAIHICKNEAIPDRVKIEVLGSNLLLYGNEFSSGTHNVMVLELFKAAKNINSEDNYTGFAAIVLLLQSPSIISHIFSTLKEDGIREIELENLDMRLVLAFFSSYDSELSQSQIVRRLLKSAPGLHETYEQFHRELFSPGSRIHDAPLVKLIKGEAKLEYTIAEASHSCDKLMYLINQINLWNFRLNDSKSSAIAKKNQDIKDQLINCKTLIATFIDETIELGVQLSDAPDIKLKIQQIQRLIKNSLIPDLTEIHSYLFYPIALNEDIVKIKSTIIELFMSQDLTTHLFDHNTSFKKIDKKNLLRSTTIINDYPEKERLLSGDRKWIVWDNLIITEIIYLFSNLRHGTAQLINDPWNKVDEQACMWFNVNYKTSGIVVHLANQSHHDANTVSRLTQKKNRPGKIHLEKMKGEVTYSSQKDDDSYILTTSLFLPYL